MLYITGENSTDSGIVQSCYGDDSMQVFIDFEPSNAIRFFEISFKSSRKELAFRWSDKSGYDFNEVISGIKPGAKMSDTLKTIDPFSLKLMLEEFSRRSENMPLSIKKFMVDKIHAYSASQAQQVGGEQSD